MLGTLRALPTLLRVGLAGAVAYRAELLVWLLSTNMPLVMLALWSAVAREAPVGRFGQREFTAYFLAALVVRLLTGAWLIWELNYEIKQGTLAFRLLRPVHPLVTYAAENLAAVPLRIALALPVTLVAPLHRGRRARHPRPAPPGALPGGRVRRLAHHLPGHGAGGRARLLDRLDHLHLRGVDGPLRRLLRLPGAARALPALARPRLARVLPFRYMLAFPVEMVTGLAARRSAALSELAVQWLFVAGLAAGSTLAWRVGLRRFAAFGG